MRLRLLLVRAVVGGLFIGHGAQKLFGWFGGHGPEGTGQFLENVGVRPGRRTAVAAGAAAAGVAGSFAVSKLAESRASAEVEARPESADRADAPTHAPA